MPSASTMAGAQNWLSVKIALSMEGFIPVRL